MILLQPVKLVMLVKPIGPYLAGSPFIFRFCKDRGEVASIKVAKPQAVACHNTTAFAAFNTPSGKAHCFSFYYSENLICTCIKYFI